MRTSFYVRVATPLVLSAHSSFAQIPEAVVDYFMGLSGCQINDPLVSRVAALAAHKFIADITDDAMSLRKQQQQGGQQTKERLVLTTKDVV